VLTRSAATTLSTLLPIIALLLFGGTTLKDFAFALLIGVASGAYSSIFIASPVLTHWKEREAHYKARRRRIEGELGSVPAYADDRSDVDPTPQRVRRTGRLTAPEPDAVSAAEFEQMKRDLEIERTSPSRGSSTRSITKRLAHTDAEDAPATPAPARTTKRGAAAAKPAAPPPRPAAPARPAPPAAPAAKPAVEDAEPDGDGRAPDIAENEGVAPVQKPKPRSKSGQRNRRPGRRR
jgi:SecD/SecF fusion protein